MEQLGGLQSTGRKESDMTEQLHFHFVLFFYLQGVSLPFHLVCIAVFAVVFPYPGSLWFFIVEVPHCGCNSTGGFSRFPG